MTQHEIHTHGAHSMPHSDEVNQATVERTFPRGFARRLPIRRFLIWVIVIWALVSIVPLILWLGNEFLIYLFGPRIPVRWSTLGTMGDIFGAANSLFAGFALVLAIFTVRQQQDILDIQQENLQGQLTELQRSTLAQERMARNHKSALSASIVMPMVDLVRSPEYGRAAYTLGTFWLSHAKTSIGEPAIAEIYEFIRDGGDFKAPPDQDPEYAKWDRQHELWEKARDSFVNQFRRLREQTRVGSGSREDQEHWDAINDARRVVVGIAQRLYRLHLAGIVEDALVARVVVGPDMVALQHYIVKPLEMVLVHERHPNQQNHDPIDYLYELYSNEEVAREFY